MEKIVDYKNYTIKTFKKVGNPDLHEKEKIYIILYKTYYDINLKKYIESGSIFIDFEFGNALIKTLGLRCFDNANIFDNV